MTMSGKYFPNNWQQVHDTPAEDFIPFEYDDFMELSMQWHIPSSIACIMRIENRSTGKIKEHAYKTTTGAQKRLCNLLKIPTMSSWFVMTNLSTY